jgi:hypothetical protein
MGDRRKCQTYTAPRQSRGIPGMLDKIINAEDAAIAGGRLHLRVLSIHIILNTAKVFVVIF